MSIQDLLRAIGEQLSTTATVKNVYGESVSAGDRTVIPVARVRYAFGAGGGATAEARAKGGGSVSAEPAGALEITSSGTRFVPFVDPKAVGIALALGAALGAVLASLTMTKRIEIVKPQPGDRR